MSKSYILTHVTLFFFCVLGLLTNQKKRLTAIWRKLRQMFIMGKRFPLASIEFTNSLFYKIQNKSPTFLVYDWLEIYSVDISTFNT